MFKIQILPAKLHMYLHWNFSGSKVHRDKKRAVAVVDGGLALCTGDKIMIMIMIMIIIQVTKPHNSSDNDDDTCDQTTLPL